jgi:predicted kinase
MKLHDIQLKQIILVCGNLASGKGHYIQNKFPDAEVIGVSSVVRELSKFATRSQLMTTKDLDKQIAQTLINRIEKSSNTKIVIDGIRQMTIMQTLEQHFKNQIKDVIWLDVPEDVRRQRFDSRKSSKDDQTFDQAIAGDTALGIGDVEQYIRQKHKVVPYT